MAVRQYIGARYVIKVYENSTDIGSAEWEANTNFEPLVLVTYNNGSYLSKKEVPATVGNPAENPIYWVQTGFYNGQIAQLQSAVNAINDRLNDIEDEITPEAIADIMADVINDMPVNRWYADNPATASAISPRSLTFKQIAKQAPMFEQEMLIDKWSPYPKATIAFAGKTIPVDEYAGKTFLKNGIHITPNGEASNIANFRVKDLLKVSHNQCIKFKSKCYPGTDVYGRGGIAINDVHFIYFDHQTKKICYENPAVSFASTPFSDTTYPDAEEMEFRCFIPRFGNTIAVYVSVDGGAFTYVGKTEGDETHVVTGDVGLFFRIWGTNPIGCEVDGLAVVYTYAAFADCRYIHYDDTTPYILNNKAYLVADVQAENSNFIGIIRHTLGCNDMELVGVIVNSYSDWANGTDICFDRKNKQFIYTARIDLGSNGLKITTAVMHNTNLSGIINITPTILPDVLDDITFGNHDNAEDPCVCFFNGHWYMGINKITGTYRYAIFRTTGDVFDINDFEHVVTIESNSLTGGCFVIIGNTLYLVCGDGSSIAVFNAVTGENNGTLEVSVDNRVWGNLTSVNKGGRTVFYLTTFDRTRIAGNQWGYGNVIMFESTDDLPELIRPNTYGTK